MTYFDDTYFEDHLYLLELSTFLEPKSQSPSTTPSSQSTTKSQSTSSGKNSSMDLSQSTKKSSALHTIGIPSSGGTARYYANQPISTKMNSSTCSITTSTTIQPYPAEISLTYIEHCLPRPSITGTVWKRPVGCSRSPTTKNLRRKP